MLFAKKVLEESSTRRLTNKNDVTSVLLIISPLNALINDQIRKLLAIGLRVSTLNVFRQALSYDNEEIDCDVSELDKKEKLVNGYYNLLFAHPEALISSKFGRELVNSARYQENVCALVIDEAHCILEWYGIFQYFLR
jgi:superfamily II DNA helicase RecQ